MPVQESGTRPARAVPYTVNTKALADLATQKVAFTFINTGAQTAVFQVRSASPKQAPRSYTVSPNRTLSDHCGFEAVGEASYDLSVYGPNGFFRLYRGGARESTAPNLVSSVAYDSSGNGVTLSVKNIAAEAAMVHIENVYSGQASTPEIAGGGTFSTFVSVANHAGWYDLIVTVESDSTLQQRLAGHLETGNASTTDPAIG
jgi:phospholipase C